MAIATVSVHVSWWVCWYVASVGLASRLIGMEPDMEKVGRWIDRGVQVRAGR